MHLVLTFHHFSVAGSGLQPRAERWILHRRLCNDAAHAGARVHLGDDAHANQGGQVPCLVSNVTAISSPIFLGMCAEIITRTLISILPSHSEITDLHRLKQKDLSVRNIEELTQDGIICFLKVDGGHDGWDLVSTMSSYKILHTRTVAYEDTTDLVISSNYLRG